MNSDEFLKLVEKHPLPITMDRDPIGRPVVTDAAGTIIEQPPFGEINSLGEALSRSAPAMAAAIIRALNDEETGTGWGPDITVAGYLRASLPEELRP